MKKMLLIVLSTFIAIGVAPIARADVNDFKITDYQIDYQLGRDESNRSTLKTVERITAFFPDSDQNHGIERALADSYDGHSTSLKIESVVDGAGMSLSYSTYENSGNTVLRIGDADTYVHGQKTYVLTYTQRDVTRYFPDNGRDEFYWDTNGTGWKVPIGNLSVSLNVDRDVDAVTLGNSCYVGAARSSDECLLTHAGNTYTVIHGRLAPGENVTIAVGFQPETFAAYEPTLWEKIFGFWLMSLVVTGAISVAVLVWLIVRYVRTRNRLNEVSTIVPEYVPPKGASVTAAAEVMTHLVRL